jgi:hypothetical protein
MPEHSIRVECNGPLPLASTIAAAVWGNGGRVVGPDRADWERLTVQSSKLESERVEIAPISKEPLVLEVSSADRKLAHAAAFHLAMETHGRFL